MMHSFLALLSDTQTSRGSTLREPRPLSSQEVRELGTEGGALVLRVLAFAEGYGAPKDITDEDTFVVAESAQRYIPDTVRAYLALTENQRTPEALSEVLSQLRMIENGVRLRYAKRHVANAPTALAENGDFLRQRFKQDSSAPEIETPRLIAMPKSEIPRITTNADMIKFKKLDAQDLEKAEAEAKSVLEYIKDKYNINFTIHCRENQWDFRKWSLSENVKYGFVEEHAIQTTAYGVLTTIRRPCEGEETVPFQKWLKNVERLAADKQRKEQNEAKKNQQMQQIAMQNVSGNRGSISIHLATLTTGKLR